jgi:hypothetical protein
MIGSTPSAAGRGQIRAYSPQIDAVAATSGARRPPQTHTSQSVVAQLRRRELGQPMSKVLARRLVDLQAIDLWEAQTKRACPAEKYAHIAMVATFFRQFACDPSKTQFTMQYGGFSTSMAHVGFLKTLPPIPSNTRQLCLKEANDLEVVDVSHCDPEKLESVEIISCNLQELPDLSGFQKIKRLNLSHNPQMRGQLSASHHPMLETLDLDLCSALGRFLNP